MFLGISCQVVYIVTPVLYSIWKYLWDGWIKILIIKDRFWDFFWFDNFLHKAQSALSIFQMQYCASSLIFLLFPCCKIYCTQIYMHSKAAQLLLGHVCSKSVVELHYSKSHVEHCRLLVLFLTWPTKPQLCCMRNQLYKFQHKLESGLPSTLMM